MTSDKNTQKGLYIKNFGCQMNVYDGDRMQEMMSSHNYDSVNSVEDADLVILNTCHIREKATEKICLLYTSPSPRDGLLSRMPSSA